MAQLVGSRLSRLAMRAGAAVCVAGVATVALSFTPVGASPLAASTTPYAYVANYGSGTVSVINTSTNTVVNTVPVGNDPEGVAITPTGTLVYVTNYSSGTVSVINTYTNTVVATVTVKKGCEPADVAITPDSGYYVADYDYDPGTVSVIDTSTNTVVKTVKVGNDPHGVAIT
jgi:YVTN family beta-propeller protein